MIPSAPIGTFVDLDRDGSDQEMLSQGTHNFHESEYGSEEEDDEGEMDSCEEEFGLAARKKRRRNRRRAESETNHQELAQQTENHIAGMDENELG
mmetsp:Transcript_12241/g.18965  ORF Transcript_12241/g.18965 Transcript_12241/m.18965 type:complete len:95 (+) Transcript_12241:1121-1405(+)